MCNFCEVCDLLFESHGEGRDGPLTTLNELFDKHLKKWQPDLHPSPKLTKENVTVSYVELEKRMLIQLPHQTTTSKPRQEPYPPRPVVVVHYRGRNCLIDGRRRINVWKRTGETGVYPVYLLTVGTSL